MKKHEPEDVCRIPFCKECEANIKKAATPQSTTPNKDLREKIEEVLEKLHEKVLIGWIVNDGKPHKSMSHGGQDGCTDKATQSLLALLDEETLKARIDELKHIDDPVNVYVYWEGLMRPLDRIQELQRATAKEGK